MSRCIAQCLGTRVTPLKWTPMHFNNWRSPLTSSTSDDSRGKSLVTSMTGEALACDITCSDSLAKGISPIMWYWLKESGTDWLTDWTMVKLKKTLLRRGLITHGKIIILIDLGSGSSEKLTLITFGVKFDPMVASRGYNKIVCCRIALAD